jgi:hypothetical protein
MGYTGDGTGIAAYAVAASNALTSDDDARPIRTPPTSTRRRAGVNADDAREAIRLKRCSARAPRDPGPAGALRWIETFSEAYGAVEPRRRSAPDRARAARRGRVVPALELERLRNRQVLFFLDTVGQYVDAQPELRGLPLDDHLAEIAEEFGIEPATRAGGVRMALTGEAGPPLELLFPLLGHDRIMMRIGAISSTCCTAAASNRSAYGPDGKPFETPALPTGKKPEQ